MAVEDSSVDEETIPLRSCCGWLTIRVPSLAVKLIGLSLSENARKNLGLHANGFDGLNGVGHIEAVVQPQRAEPQENNGIWLA